jgi:ABC-type polysaccharide/polyol phosphate export permease
VKKEKRILIDQVYMLAKQAVTVKYKRTILGLFWSLLSPLFLMTTSAFIFSNVFAMSFIDFTVHMFVGMSVWTIFATTVHQGSGAITGNEHILKKINVNPMLFPVVSMVAAFVEALPMIMLTYVLVAASGLIDIWGVLKIIPLLLLVACFSLGLGMVLSIICVKYRDLQYIISVLLQVWFYATPILYKGEMLGQKFDFLLYLNPMANFLTIIRSQQNNYNGDGNLTLAIASGIASLLIGIFCMNKFSKHLTKKL